MRTSSSATYGQTPSPPPGGPPAAKSVVPMLDVNLSITRAASICCVPPGWSARVIVETPRGLTCQPRPRGSVTGHAFDSSVNGVVAALLFVVMAHLL